MEIDSILDIVFKAGIACVLAAFFIKAAIDIIFDK